MIICTIKTLDYVIFCSDMEQVIKEIQNLERIGESYSYELNAQSAH